jgi:CheY-like chemotaxis protein
VAVSGYGRGDDRQRAVEAGFDAPMTKPIGLEELEATSLIEITRRGQGKTNLYTINFVVKKKAPKS